MSSPLLRIAGIEDESIVDGPGIRMCVFVQGCTHNCPGCHNPQTHALDGGTVMSAEEIWQLFAQDPLLSGITFSGGEPFLQPEGLVWLAKKVHEAGKTVFAYSGFTYEQLLARAMEDSHTEELLGQVDWLVDGPYVEALRNLELEFRGSSNPRLLEKTDMEELARLWKQQNARAR